VRSRAPALQLPSDGDATGEGLPAVLLNVLVRAADRAQENERIALDSMRAALDSARIAQENERAATAKSALVQANLFTLRLKYLDALRYKQIMCVRGALDTLLDDLGVEAAKASLATYFVNDVRGMSVLECCNANAKVMRDHFNKPHTAESLAEWVLRIRERLNNGSLVKTTAKAYWDEGDRLVMFADSMTEAQVEVMACFFSTHEFPVHVMSRLPAFGLEDGSGM
jgi:hypothetical protein